MKRKRVVPKKLALARADHDKFLRKLGIDPTKKPVLKGVRPDILHPESYVRKGPDIKTSDLVPGAGAARQPAPFCGLPLAQVFHKGPLMVVTNFSDLEGSKRR